MKRKKSLLTQLKDFSKTTIKGCQKQRLKDVTIHFRDCDHADEMVIKIVKKENKNMNNIKSFYIGKENATGQTFDNIYDFFEALKEEIQEAEKDGKEYFDITIEETEC